MRKGTVGRAFGFGLSVMLLLALVMAAPASADMAVAKAAAGTRLSTLSQALLWAAFAVAGLTVVVVTILRPRSQDEATDR